MRKPEFHLDWDTTKLARSMHIEPIEAIVHFSDGRNISNLLELGVKNLLGGELAPSKHDVYDVMDPEGRKWEVRSMTRASGLSFRPSNQTGGSRVFNEELFLAKLHMIDGFIICDLAQFPHVDIYRISCAEVLAWYRAGKLRQGAERNYDAALALVTS